jgi:hypothetical protein
MKNAQYVQIVALSLIIVFSLSFVSRTISQNWPHQLAAISGADSGLLSHYTFDEGSGSTAGDLMGGNTGTLVNNPSWSTEGKYGTALSFNGNNYVNVGTGLNLTGAVTVSAWVKSGTNSIHNIIAGRGNTGASAVSAQQFRLDYAADARPRFQVSNGTASIISQSVSNGAPNGVWNHIVGTYNGTDTTALYINGVRVDTDTSLGFGALNSAPVGFGIGGRQTGGAGLFTGTIDDVRVYSRELSLLEVQEIYSLGGETQSPPPPPPPPPSDNSTPPVVGNRVDQLSGSGGLISSHTTIQTCANSANPGDTCLVYPGNYPEFVQITTRAGVSGAPIIFRAVNNAKNTPVLTERSRVKGFRIGEPYITIDGFDISKHGKGLSTGHITVDPGSNFCTIENNIIHDGVFLSKSDYKFDATTKTITSPTGGLIAAGFESGMRVYIASDITNHIFNNNQIKTIAEPIIQNPDGSETMKLVSTDTLITEDLSVPDGDTADEFALLYATGSEKDGFEGIRFNLNSTVGGSNNCVIRNNTLSNLGGTALVLQGSNTTIENNIIERMNGWWIIYFGGSNNVFRYNHIRNSPRYAGFKPPTADTVHSSGGGTWDFYAAILRSFGSPSIASVNNVFEYNMFEGLDNEFSLITENAPGNPNPPKEARKTIFRNNIFAGTEMQGAIHRRETIFENNTFYKVSQISPGSTFSLTTTNAGSADQSLIRNNVFVGNNTPGNTHGWYSIEDVLKLIPIMVEAPNYNFVAAGPEQNYAAKSGFVGKETNGVNGGDPQFKNINNIVGPDGRPFTLDDGLKPLSTSPLCKRGYGGSDIGAYSCDPGVVFAQISSAPLPTILKAGDFNGDGTVNTNDYSYLNSSWNTSDPTTDLNKDGRVNTLDYAIMVQNWMK